MAKTTKKVIKQTPKPKKKASKYNEKFVVDASFEDLSPTVVFDLHANKTNGRRKYSFFMDEEF